MPTGLIDDDRFLLHHAGAGHPERPARIAAARRGLDHANLTPRLTQLTVEPATREVLARLHDSAYIDRVVQACEDHEPWVDTPDAPCSQDTAEVAALAVGGVLAAVAAVVDGEVDNAFCLVRPPGHHAERGRSMGFCFFNSIALAADAAVRDHGLSRVAIVDFDVHHGNGTQHLLERRGDILFISLHAHPDTLYPGTGYAHERGTGQGEGYTLNLPLPPGSGDAEYLEAMDRHALPALDAFQPELLLISAGFDGHEADPLAHHRMTARGYAALTRRLRDAADRHCRGRLVSTLEGGYDLDALAACVAAHVEALL